MACGQQQGGNGREGVVKWDFLYCRTLVDSMGSSVEHDNTYLASLRVRVHNNRPSQEPRNAGEEVIQRCRRIGF